MQGSLSSGAESNSSNVVGSDASSSSSVSHVHLIGVLRMVRLNPRFRLTGVLMHIMPVGSGRTLESKCWYFPVCFPGGIAYCAKLAPGTSATSAWWHNWQNSTALNLHDAYSLKASFSSSEPASRAAGLAALNNRGPVSRLFWLTLPLAARQRFFGDMLPTKQLSKPKLRKVAYRL